MLDQSNSRCEIGAKCNGSHNGDNENDVLILPLSVIAGRQGTGLVTVITPNGERVETKVTLGVTDGANIEILSGLEEGDVVSATPPNLDPRGI